MSRLLTGYAGWFNKKYHRHGQLFYNRYKSILCQEDAYLKDIHLNSLRVAIVEELKELDKYFWCGHSSVMGKKEQPWQNVDYVYRLFSEKKKEARKIYRAFVKKGIEEGKRTDLTGGGLLRNQGGWEALKGYRKAGIRLKGDERILGDSDFVEKVLKSAQESLEEKYGLKYRGYDFDKAAERVSELMDMDVSQVLAFGKAPETVQARALLCFWAHRKLGMTTIETAGRLKISQSAVSRMSKKGEIIEKEKSCKLNE